MAFSKNSRIGIALVVVAIVVVTPLVLLSFMNQVPPLTDDIDDSDTTDEVDDPYEPETLQLPVESINITLFTHSGTMIEANNIRIYVDPYDLPEDVYSEYPADLVLITHSHFDHYSLDDIRLVETNDTLVVLPQRLAPNLPLHDNGMVVNPGDSFDFGGINITTFYMYYEPSVAHPKEDNSNSYFIEIDGFIIFHGGAAKYMPELENMTMDIDVALLGIVYDAVMGTRDTNFLSIIQAIETIKPDYCIPTHWLTEDDRVLFQEGYVPLLEDNCVVLDLDFYGFHVFSNDN
ncbi:MAG: MBL fold metallo-hydrolase [Candidatus Thorarchaeota archaeon]